MHFAVEPPQAFYSLLRIRANADSALPASVQVDLEATIVEGSFLPIIEQRQFFFCLDFFTLREGKRSFPSGQKADIGGANRMIWISIEYLVLPGESISLLIAYGKILQV